MTDIYMIRAIIGHSQIQQLKDDCIERTKEILASYYTRDNPGKRFTIDTEIEQSGSRQTDLYFFTIAPRED